MRGEIFTLLLVTWPCLQALFIVESEQDSYDGELHDKITMGCRFSHVPSVSRITIIWQRVSHLETVGVYQLDKGNENPNFTSVQYQSRVRLLREELEKFRAVIELSQLRLNDSGTYQCIVIQDEVDYKQTKLTIRAPYKPIKKTFRRLSEKQVELSCESQGLPLARVTWSDGKLTDLTNRSKSSHETNSDGVFVVTSRLSVAYDVNNYTCSYMTDDSQTRQTAMFSIPDEIPGKSKLTTGYAAIAVIVVMCVGLVLALLILRRRKKGQKRMDISSEECESPQQNLTVTSTDHLLSKSNSRFDSLTFTSAYNVQEVLKQKYAEFNKTTETKTDFTLPHTLLSGENQHVDIHSVLPGPRETVLLEGKEGAGKTSVAQTLAWSWADQSSLDFFNIRKLQLVILVDIKEDGGEFFQMVNSKIPAEAGLQTNKLKDILLGDGDSLIILDGYKEGDRELDTSLIKFLRERRTCRVLITACPGEHGILGETGRKVMRLHTLPVQA
ncbi:hypothetical protein AMELA_G00204880 [Ameiurus melas]|uniref:Ig-like domain-containing protein n=1 Tax=Ameiurus melas TaxID=219545 RepID=A0A7J6A4U6_AMEME|nr:hypothetical protein AMELA_G00204880 [Ameiurus melas]